MPRVASTTATGEGFALAGRLALRCPRTPGRPLNLKGPTATTLRSAKAVSPSLKVTATVQISQSAPTRLARRQPCSPVDLELTGKRVQVKTPCRPNTASSPRIDVVHSPRDMGTGEQGSLRQTEAKLKVKPRIDTNPDEPTSFLLRSDGAVQASRRPRMRSSEWLSVHRPLGRQQDRTSTHNTNDADGVATPIGPPAASQRRLRDGDDEISFRAAGKALVSTRSRIQTKRHEPFYDRGGHGQGSAQANGEALCARNGHVYLESHGRNTAAWVRDSKRSRDPGATRRSARKKEKEPAGHTGKRKTPRCTVSLDEPIIVQGWGRRLLGNHLRRAELPVPPYESIKIKGLPQAYTPTLANSTPWQHRAQRRANCRA
ncbi:hypothetical protein DFP72DRAFT_1058375 [Ephemerocybe angulata]|uniref:Uncharacterized protein n=1 Tax=Ephemerocybe angulata TaxID=980116 RepID=A0A8H6MGK5_9AGAR|nr:hypothetical protein DFP72DRAFT_1058375 [Tulosesus angulatus]